MVVNNGMIDWTETGECYKLVEEFEELRLGAQKLSVGGARDFVHRCHSVVRMWSVRSKEKYSLGQLISLHF